jgi:two-component system, response regulator / RNA-binding antiterminator
MAPSTDGPASSAALRVLLVDDDDTRARDLTATLRAAGYSVLARLRTAEPLAERVLALKPDVVIVDVNSPDRDVLENLNRVTHEQPRPIVVFTDDERSDVMAAALRAGVSAYVMHGLEARRVKPVVELAMARFREHEALRRELAETRAQLAERKWVERAKAVLMEKRAISEAQAYAQLRKLAMDRGVRIGQVARSVLDAAELLG